MAAADLNTIRSVIEARLATELAGTQPFRWCFTTCLPPTPNSSWVRPYSFGNNEFLSLGGTSDSDNRIVGVVVINIFSAAGVGPGANYVIGKRVRDLYNRVNVSGVYFDAPIGPEVLASPAPEGYFQTQVRVTFESIEEL